MEQSKRKNNAKKWKINQECKFFYNVHVNLGKKNDILNQQLQTLPVSCI